MEKKTIGQFIAILRKANGLTQQDLADRLNVSNKAVSRWERDESAPDITLIPALAELLGVTCDELLKGERITYEQQIEKKEVKVEKQVHSLIWREISKYRTRLWIAFVLAVVGIPLPFAVAQSSYFSEEICLASMFLCELIAFVMVRISVQQMRDIKSGCELFENADVALIKEFNSCLGAGSYRVYFSIVSILLTFLVLYTRFTNGGGGLVKHFVMLVALYWLCKERYVTWVTGNKYENKKNAIYVTKIRKMNIIQIGAILFGVGVGLGVRFLESGTEVDDLLWTIALVIVIGLVLVNILTPIIFAVRNRESKKTFLFWGLRNSLLMLSGYYATEICSTSWSNMTGNGLFKFYTWYPWEMHTAIVWAVCVITVFYLIGRKVRK